MANKAVIRTKVVETLKTTGQTVDTLIKAIGGPLSSPINSKAEGEAFDVTFNGKIEIREYDGRKAAYLLTKEGFSIKVNAGFDAKECADGKIKQAQCLVAQIDERQIKYCALVA